MIRSFRQVGLCETSPQRALYSTIVEYIDENLDLRLDGSVDADKPCDAVSFGVAYQAAQLTPGPVERSPSLVECCEPGVAIEECSPVCGDGVRTGKEKCDTGVPAGEAGACPTECPALERCAPRVLDGSACQAQCVVTALPCESGDGCCPGSCTNDNDQDCAAR